MMSISDLFAKVINFGEFSFLIGLYMFSLLISSILLTPMLRDYMKTADIKNSGLPSSLQKPFFLLALIFYYTIIPIVFAFIFLIPLVFVMDIFLGTIF